MAKLFKRELPQYLKDYKRDFEAGTKVCDNNMCKQFKCSKSNQIVNYCSSLTGVDDKRVTENDLLPRTDALKTLDKNFNKEKEKNYQRCSKSQALKLYNNELKDNINKNKSDFVQLQSTLVSAEKQLLQKNDALAKAHRLNIVIYNAYKMFSGCKIYFESSQIVRLEFAPDIYIKLLSKNWKSNWYLVDIKPDLKNRSKIEEKLLETDHIQAFIASIFRSFQLLLKKSRLREKEFS